jgi:hypothetical protein
MLGGLLALITLSSLNSHVHIPVLGSIALDQQIGVLLIVAVVPALLGVDAVFSEGVAELATRCRLRGERERDRADRERERAARRAQRQAECNLVQLRHQLEPKEPNAQRIRDVISLLEEYGGFVGWFG